MGSENVVIDINQLSSDDMQNATLNAANAAAEDWDISNGAGWGPDYQDPSTYLDILKQHQVKIPRFSMVMMTPNNAAAAQVVLRIMMPCLIQQLQKQQTSTLVTTVMLKPKLGWKIALLSFH